jgi:hypothetical protein
MAIQKKIPTGIDLEFSTDYIWAMEDKEGYLGLRLDSGDSGTIYFTPRQAISVIAELSTLLLLMDSNKK